MYVQCSIFHQYETFLSHITMGLARRTRVSFFEAPADLEAEAQRLLGWATGDWAGATVEARWADERERRGG